VRKSSGNGGDNKEMRCAINGEKLLGVMKNAWHTLEHFFGCIMEEIVSVSVHLYDIDSSCCE
jgi:hypothetical protein